MLSKNKSKYLKSLELKKKRKEENVFVAEGHKIVDELIEYFSYKIIIALPEWINNHKNLQASEIIEVSQDELNKISFQKTPQDVFAVFNQPSYEIDENIPSYQLCIALDGVQDPGNLGTIIRVADWFGIENIYCSFDTVDAFNPKTIQATMGAIARVKLHYCNLPSFLKSLKNVPIYGTFLEGDIIYNETLSKNGIIVMGNEGNGISNEIKEIVTNKLFIPNYPPKRETSESLNVAMATGIICSEFRRKSF